MATKGGPLVEYTADGCKHGINSKLEYKFLANLGCVMMAMLRGN